MIGTLITPPRRTFGITAPHGFTAAGVHCGIRHKRPDLALIVSDRPASAAAVFTRNLVQAAPIHECRRNLEESGGRARAIVVNSGNANACTGAPGDAAARATVAETARVLGLAPAEVLVASTGVIGQQLPVDKILAALPAAAAGLSAAGGEAAAEAILTTDTCTKESGRRVDGTTIGGVAKGSGMIHPDMATTLAFVTTDAAVDPAVLSAMLRRSVEHTFNRISVDGETSTNDMVAVLANGAAGVEIGAWGPRCDRFEQALAEVLEELALAVVRDGEGGSCVIAVKVTGAASEDDAAQVARTVAGSPLVKTAVHGHDANWGRIVAAAGRAGVAVEPERFRVSLCGLEVLAPGYVSDYSEEEATELLKRDEVTIALDLGQGTAGATAWTCDLSAEYVEINASYRT